MKRKLSPRALYGLVAAGLLVYALVGWFMFVSPKRAHVGELQQEVSAAELAVSTARAALAAKGTQAPIAVADIFRLAKAMPAVPDMPGLLLELSRIADETGIRFQSITPGASTTSGTYQKVPLTLVFDGNFYELSDFLFRLRTLVSVRRGVLHAQGRLFSVDTIDFAESAVGFPEITASLGVSAYVYGTAAPASTLPPATPQEAATPPASGTEAPATGGSEASAAEVSP